VSGGALVIGLLLLDRVFVRLGLSLLLLGGGVKLSVVPLHVWLGKVHAEASTVGSVLLAGVGLKLGWVVAAWSASLGSWPSLLACLLVSGLVLSCGLLSAVDAKRWVAV